MNSETKNTILKILEAIDYSDDKEDFVNKFIEIINIQTIESLAISLPLDQQNSLKNELTANKNNPEKVGEILKSRFSDEQTQKSLEEVSKNAVSEWMQAVSPTLSEEQRQKLLDLSKELNPTPPPAPTS